MAMVGLADIHTNSWGRTVMDTQISTGWQSPPDPTGNQTIVVDQIVVPALAP